MALLQIHEPGQTPLPHSDMVAVGIDLGTTNSVVAVAHGGQVEVLLDTCGNALLPSVVEYAADGSVKVGTAADAVGASTISSVKRRMNAANEAITLPNGKQVMPVGVSTDILRAVKARAERAMGRKVEKAVITVPAYFDDAARTATKDAAKLAGLDVLRLVNEPTAAALAYGLDNAAEGIYAIYDLGGGTFDVSVLKLEKGVFQVLATGGDTQLGGDDFDHAVAEYLGGFIPPPVGGRLGGGREGTPSSHHAPTPTLPLRERGLLLIARKAKEYLSAHEHGEWENKRLDRATLNRLIVPLVERTIATCAQVVEDAGIAVGDIKGVVLVGGSTRVPLVREKVAEFFKQTPLTDVDPDLVVAHGAALQAEALTRGSGTLLLDVTPLSLGLETMGGIVEKVIHRNSPIPVAVSQEFTTYQDGQTGMQIQVLQGERELAKDCRSLAHFELAGIPPMVAGAARVNITFTVDTDGLLTVSAREQTTGVEQSVAVKPSYGLPPEQMADMLRDSMKHAREDMNARLLAEAKSEANRSILALESALEQDGDLLSAVERKPVEQQMKRLKLALQGEDRDIIAAEADRLEEGIKAFATRRLERGVTSALKGHTLADVEKTLLTESK